MRLMKRPSARIAIHTTGKRSGHSATDTGCLVLKLDRVVGLPLRGAIRSGACLNQLLMTLSMSATEARLVKEIASEKITGNC